MCGRRRPSGHGDPHVLAVTCRRRVGCWSVRRGRRSRCRAGREHLGPQPSRGWSPAGEIADGQQTPRCPSGAARPHKPTDRGTGPAGPDTGPATGACQARVKVDSRGGWPRTVSGSRTHRTRTGSTWSNRSRAFSSSASTASRTNLSGGNQPNSWAPGATLASTCPVLFYHPHDVLGRGVRQHRIHDAGGLECS